MAIGATRSLPSRIDLSYWLRDITAALATALAYFFCALIGLFFVFGHEGIAALWPASGVFCAAIVINRGRRLWLIVLFTALADFAAAYWINRTPFVFSLCFMATIASESALAAWVLVRLRGRTLGFGKVPDVLALTLGASSAPAVGGFIAAAVVHTMSGEPLWENWHVWWLADSVGILAVVPVILAWRAQGWGALRVSDRGRALEIVVFFGVLVGALCLVFGAGD
ncbi:MAG: MASE1 domain-containing protein [Gammaproteobacteria bacterium]